MPERIRTLSTTVKDLFGVAPRQLPLALAPLPRLLRKTSSTACQNASEVLASRMVPPETPELGRQQTYRVLRDAVLTRAGYVSAETHSVTSQAVALMERMSYEEANRVAVLGAISAKVADFDFLIALRDQFSSS
ncbi:MAG: hypothetical protein ABIS59_03855 [Candidatus Saccharibacteria bacterium]